MSLPPALRRLAIWWSALLVASAPLAGAAEFLHGATRLLFLGDSITYGGQYVDRFEAFLLTQHRERKFEVLNCGLPSETVSGLSEEGHAGGKFPRPDLHERLTRVLDAVKPQLVFACYGMNDGIYLPLDEGRMTRFRDGITRLHDEVVKRGARIIHLTPAVYHPTHPEERATSYDAVLARYSAWLLEQRARGWEVIDLHGPMSDAIEANRKSDPAFTFSKDRIHPNEAGHAVMADALIAAVDPAGAKNFQALPASPWAASPAGKAFHAALRKRGRILIDAWLGETKHLRPGMAKGLPLAEAQAKAAELERELAANLPPQP